MTASQMPYSIVRKIGSGSHGTVYEIVDSDSQRHALKILQHDSYEVENFQGVKHLVVPSHPHILSPDRLGRTAQNKIFLRFRYIDQIDAHRAVTTGGPAVAVSLLIQAASALSFLHMHGLVHGDVKPENVLVESRLDGGELDLVLCDLELSRQNSRMHGTLGYLAPEILAGGPSTPTSDIFSLGAWFIWLVTGMAPFVGSTVAQSLDLARNPERVLPLGRTSPEYSGPFWEELLPRMISEQAEDRFTDGLDVLKYLITRWPPISCTADCIPQLLWNPKAMPISTMEAVLKLEQSLALGNKYPNIVMMTGLHRSALTEILAMACCRCGLGLDDAIVITPDCAMDDVVKTCTQDLLVVNNHSPSGVRLSPDDLVNVVNTCMCKGEPNGLRHVVILESSLEDSSHLRFKIDHTILRCDVGESWSVGLFSGVEIAPQVAAHLGISEYRPVQVERALSRIGELLKTDILTINQDANIGISPGKEAEFLKSVSGSNIVPLSDEATCYLNINLQIQNGFSARFRKAVCECFGNKCERELAEAGLINIDEGGRSYIANPQAAFMLTDAAPMLDPSVIQAFKGIATGCEHIVCEVLGPQAGSRAILRALAYASSQVKRMNVYAALRLLSDLWRKNIPEHLSGRLLWIRAHAWEAIDKLNRAARDAEASTREYEREGSYVLAARSAVYLAEMHLQRSRRDLYRSELIRAENLVSRVNTHNAAVFAMVVRAEQAQSCRSAGNYESSDALCEELLHQASNDNRVVAMCARTCGLNAESRGDMSTARRYWALGLRKAKCARSIRLKARISSTVAIYEFNRGFFTRSERLIKNHILKTKSCVSSNDRYTGWTALGGSAYEMGNMSEALLVNMQALAQAEEQEDSNKIRHASQNCALVLYQMDRLAESLRYALRSVESGKTVVEHGVRPLMNVADVYIEVGSFTLAERTINAFLSEKVNSPLRESMGIRRLAKIRLLQNNVQKGMDLCTAAHSLDVVTQARDEALITEWLSLSCERALGKSHDEIGRVRDLELRANELKTWLLAVQFRFTRLQWDEGAEEEARLAELNGMIAECFRKGYAILELPMLELKATLLMRLGRLIEAQDVLREALGRIKAISSEFTDPELRRTYLADPRRRRFLDLVKAARPG